MKYANILSSRPYEMIVASRELLSWVHGSYKEEPPLDISYCHLHARKQRFSLILKTSVAGSPIIVIENIMPVGLEPVMGPVAVKHTASTSSRVKAVSSSSSEALFVYPLASTLVTEMEWHGVQLLSTSKPVIVDFQNSRVVVWLFVMTECGTAMLMVNMHLL